MEDHAQKLDGPSMDALQMAAAMKRMLKADNGELAERWDSLLKYPLTATDNAMFFAIFGVEISALRKELHLDPLEDEEAEENPGTATCGACHHANGMHEPDCGETG